MIVSGGQQRNSAIHTHVSILLLQESFPDGSVGKNSPANAGDQVQSLSREDPLVGEIATYSSILAGKFHGWRRLEGHSPWG